MPNGKRNILYLYAPRPICHDIATRRALSAFSFFLQYLSLFLRIFSHSALENKSLPHGTFSFFSIFRAYSHAVTLQIALFLFITRNAILCHFLTGFENPSILRRVLFNHILFVIPLFFLLCLLFTTGEYERHRYLPILYIEVILCREGKINTTSGNWRI